MRTIDPSGNDVNVVLTSRGELPVSASSTSSTVTVVGGATSANQVNGSQLVAITGNAAQAAIGQTAKTNPFGSLYVVGAVTRLFDDTFDQALNTTDKWTLSGTTLPAVSGTSAVLSLTASNSASSVMSSIPTFVPQGQPFLLAGQIGIGAPQVNPNAHRFFGMGVVTSYTSATPLTNGLGFEVDLTGALNVVLYISGTRYVVNSTDPALITPPGSWAANMILSNYGQNLTWPASGVAIITIQYVSGLAYFYMADSGTGVDVPVAVASFVPNVASLPVRIGAITTPAVSTVLATTLTVTGLALGSIGGTNYTQSDATFPWRQQQIDSIGRSTVVTPNQVISGTITTQNLVPTGTATAGSAVVATMNGANAILFQVTGTYTGALNLQATVDGVTWATIGGLSIMNTGNGTSVATIASAVTGIFYASVGGATQVRVTGLAAVTGTATVTINTSVHGTIVNNIGQSSGRILVAGDIAIDAPATANPVGVGGRVKTANVTTYVAGDVSALFFTSDGAAIQYPYAAPELAWQASSGLTPLATTTSTAMRAAAASGLRNYLTGIQIVNTSATVSTTVTILDGAAVIWAGYLPAITAALPAVNLDITFPTPLKGTAVTAMNIQLGTTSASVYWNAQGFIAP